MKQDSNIHETPSAALSTEQVAEDIAQDKATPDPSRKLKRGIIITLAGMAVFSVVAIVLITLMNGLLEKGKDNTTSEPPKSAGVIFYEPDYEIDILKDPEYLELDRYISLKRGSYTVALDPEKLAGYSPAVSVLCQLVDALIRGDAETYNSLFSDRYYQDSANEPEDPFTMQRIYDIEIEEIREQNMSTEEDGSYTEYIYQLTYKINRNDGSYRADIGHDSSRPQYFQLTDREGEVKIDRLVYMNVQY